MHAAVRPYATATVALVGASVIAVTPIAPPPPDVHVANPAVRLAADSGSIANVPVNLIEAILNIPANEIEAIQRFAYSLMLTGNWYVYHPNNVMGTDPADPPKWKALVDMLVPFPALSGPLGEQLAVITQAELPMNAGCTGFPKPCADLDAYLGGLFQVPISQLISGYTFPTLVNPVTPPGEEPVEVPWSGQKVQLDPLAPIRSFVQSLLAEPSGIKPVSLQDVITTATNLVEALWVDFYPFVTNSLIFDPETSLLAYVTRPLAPILCGCDPGTAFPASPAPDPGPPPGPLGGDVQQNVITANNVFTGIEVGSTTAKQNVITANNVVTGIEVGSTTAKQNVITANNVVTGIEVGSTTAKQNVITANNVVTGIEVGSTTAKQNVITDDNVFTGIEVGSTTAKQNVVPGTATEVPFNAAAVLDPVSKKVDPEGGQGPDTPNAAVENLKPTTTASTNMTSNGKKVEPGQAGGRHRKPPTGLAGPVKSVNDRISSSISKVTNGLKGGDAKTDATDSKASDGKKGE